MAKEVQLSDDTKIPLAWVFALLMGCAATLTAAIMVGSYVGNNDARAQAIEHRLSSLEAALEVIPKIDRRLARMEGARGVDVPETDRFPAAKEE